MNSTTVQGSRPRALCGDTGETTSQARAAILGAPSGVFVVPRLLSSATGVLLRDMVRAGQLVRVARGVYYRQHAGEVPSQAVAEQVLAGECDHVDLKGNPVQGSSDTGSFAGALTREYLLLEYAAGTRSAAAIAEDVGCDADTVLRALRRHQIPVRGRGRPSTVPQVLTRDLLERAYEQRRLDVPQIAASTGCTEDDVVRALRSFGIKRARRGFGDVLTREYLQTQYVRNGLTTIEIGRIVGCSDTTVRNALDSFGIARAKPVERLRYDEKLSRDFLVREYVTLGRTQEEVAMLVGCNRHTVARHLRRHGLLRLRGEASPGAA